MRMDSTFNIFSNTELTWFDSINKEFDEVLDDSIFTANKGLNTFYLNKDSIIYQFLMREGCVDFGEISQCIGNSVGEMVDSRVHIDTRWDQQDTSFIQIKIRGIDYYLEFMVIQDTVVQVQSYIPS